jgi:hypothetical protein
MISGSFLPPVGSKNIGTHANLEEPCVRTIDRAGDRSRIIDHQNKSLTRAGREAKESTNNILKEIKPLEINIIATSSLDDKLFSISLQAKFASLVFIFYNFKIINFHQYF